MGHNIDEYGRPHTYMRISLTDKCNLSCRYCTPVSYLNQSKSNYNVPIGYNREMDIDLSLEEIIKVASAAASFGIDKIRLTGGEPLCRNDLESIIEGVKRIKGIKRVSLTTNGALLSKRINGLKAVGVDSINISLDSLDRKRFASITGKDMFHQTIDGIFASIEIGFKPKINAVALKDLSFEEIDCFYEFASTHPVEIRFIERMPLCGEAISETGFVSVSRIENYLTSKYNITNPHMSGVAKVYPLNGGRGGIGLISPISKPFCNQCNRLRLSSYGVIYGCLLDSRGISIRNMLRDGAGEEKLLRIFEQALSHKKKSHGLSEFSLKQRAPEIKNLIRVIGG